MRVGQTSDWPVLAACIGRGRFPDGAEIERLARRIWRETHADGTDWADVVIGSEQHRRTVAIAHAAVGLRPGEAGKHDGLEPGADEQDVEQVSGTLLLADQRANGPRPRLLPDGVDKRLKDQPLSDDDYATLAAFRHDLRRFLRFSEKAAAEAGITAQQYQVLLALRAAPGGRLSVGELADQMLLAPHSASGLISRIEAAGMIERLKPPGDGRRVDIRLAKVGSTLLDSLARAHRGELKQLRPMLRDLIARLG